MRVIWNTALRRGFPLPVPLAAAALAALLTGCGGEDRPLRLSDLTSAELRYVTRFVTLERARAVALADRPLGDALLDSLSAAWGDSSLAEAKAALPHDPRRLGRLDELLARLLAAEQDSLLVAPVPRRLRAPLTEPPPEPKSPDVAGGSP